MECSKCSWWRRDEEKCADEIEWFDKLTGEPCCRYHENAIVFLGCLQDTLRDLEKENAHLRAALEKIAAAEPGHVYFFVWKEISKGVLKIDEWNRLREIARQALEEPADATS